MKAFCLFLVQHNKNYKLNSTWLFRNITRTEQSEDPPRKFSIQFLYSVYSIIDQTKLFFNAFRVLSTHSHTSDRRVTKQPEVLLLAQPQEAKLCGEGKRTKRRRKRKLSTVMVARDYSYPFGFDFCHSCKHTRDKYSNGPRKPNYYTQEQRGSETVALPYIHILHSIIAATDLLPLVGCYVSYSMLQFEATPRISFTA